MIVSFGKYKPSIDPTAWVAADATISGNVTLGAGCRVMHGARLIAEAGSSITIGQNCIILENAVLRASYRHSCLVGDHCLFGPNSHVVGAKIEDEVFVATGASVFHGAHLGKGSEIRINGVVHLRTRLEAGSTVPIGWVAVGDPSQILPASDHDTIWKLQAPLDFPGFVYGIDRNSPDVMRRITASMSEALSMHRTEVGI